MSRNRDADFHAAMVQRAIALRFLYRCTAALDAAEMHGGLGTLDDAGPRRSLGEVSRRYEQAVLDMAERPATAAAAMSLVEFVAVVSADELFEDVTGFPPGPVSRARDRFDQLVALEGVASWINPKAAAEPLDAERKSAKGVPQAEPVR